MEAILDEEPAATPKEEEPAKVEERDEYGDYEEEPVLDRDSIGGAPDGEEEL